MFGVPVVTCVRAFLHFARKAAGAFRHPAFPAPSLFWADNDDAELGQIMPRERGCISA
jgi:hypothetical protein